MNAVIDTCVILDLLQRREPFLEDAYKIFQLSAGNKINGFIAAKSTTDIYYLMHKVFHDDTQTRKALSTLFRIFKILDTTALDCQLAVLSPIGDYEDAVTDETAFRSGMDCIITRNIQDYNNSIVPVYLPHDFLELIN